MRWKTRVLDLLFPPKCVFCEELMERGRICPACEQKLRAMDSSRRTLDGGLVAVSALPYEGVVRESLLRFKFEERMQYAEVYGEILARTAAMECGDGFDLVTWIPVSKQRRRERGYDQSELLAKAMCSHWGVDALRTLEKIQHNPAQSGLASADERRGNVLGVYEAVKGEDFAGKRLLLVDDILTTGSTAAEAARVLRMAAAAEITVLTLAAASEKK